MWAFKQGGRFGLWRHTPASGGGRRAARSGLGPEDRTCRRNVQSTRQYNTTQHNNTTDTHRGTLKRDKRGPVVERHMRLPGLALVGLLGLAVRPGQGGDFMKPTT